MLGKEILEHGEHQHDKSFDNLSKAAPAGTSPAEDTLSFWMC